MLHAQHSHTHISGTASNEHSCAQCYSMYALIGVEQHLCMRACIAGASSTLSYLTSFSPHKIEEAVPEWLHIIRQYVAAT